MLHVRGPNGEESALKLLLGKDSGAFSRFAGERRLLSELSEEGGFVPILDAGLSEHGPYLVMPFVRGGTLRERLALGELDVDDSIDLVRILAAAMARSHELGIVHRSERAEPAGGGGQSRGWDDLRS